MNTTNFSYPLCARTPVSFNKMLLAFVLSGVLLAASFLTTQAATISNWFKPVCNSLAAALAAGPCALDQSQNIANGSQPFGAATVLNQTFKPTMHGPVCKVQVKIRRNTTAGAGVLKLSVLDLNNAVQDSAAILVAPPLGESIQTFEMGCDGGILNPGQTYRLKLEAPTSLLGTYSWMDWNGNIYPAGQGINPLRDYTFRVYICPQ